MISLVRDKPPNGIPLDLARNCNSVRLMPLFALDTLRRSMDFDLLLRILAVLGNDMRRGAFDFLVARLALAFLVDFLLVRAGRFLPAPEFMLLYIITPTKLTIE